MTPRLIAALGVANLDDQGQVRPTVSSLNLLRGLLEDDEHFAVRLLLAQCVAIEALVEGTADINVEESTSPAAGLGEILLERLTMPARLACASALEAVVELGHNDIGCEHLLSGRISVECQARDLLTDHGMGAAALRQSIVGASAGIALERSREIEHSTRALADISMRLEAVERRLSGTS